MSELRANTISDAAGTGPVTLTKQSAAKMYSCFNGIGTVSIVDSFNVSSLTDNGTGSYTNTLTSALALGTSRGAVSSSGGGETSGNIASDTTVNILVRNSAGTAADSGTCLSAAHGDLA